MPEPKIALAPDSIYHIYNHASGNENIFRNTDNFHYFLNKYNYYIDPIADTQAYCLLPNHLHLLIKTKEEDVLMSYFSVINRHSTLQGYTLEGLNVSKLISQQFSNLFNSYAQAYNRKFDRKGNLFIPRFKRKLVEDDSYYNDLLAYIHNNPVHHGFVENPEDWKFSSYHQYNHPII
jgi:putative transposase